MAEASKNLSSFETRDVEYLIYGGHSLLARLYRPEGAGPFPAIVDVHGGAWTVQTRLQNAHIHEKLAMSGIMILALDFSLPPDERFPVPPQQINFGIRWLKANAARLGTHPSLVGGFGSSSGGHQIMLSALRPHDPIYAAIELTSKPDFDASLHFAVLAWPVIDPLARYRMAQRQQKRNLLKAHCAYFSVEAEMEIANPQLIVERGEATHMPPLLLVQGTDDDNLLPDMPDRFAEVYRRLGGEISIHKFDGQPHTFITKKPEATDSDTAISLITAFILEKSKDALARQTRLL